MKKILIYGDSNVWGDNFIIGKRIDDEKQWTQILQKDLGDQAIILQEGLPGRLAGNDEKEKTYKNGKDTFISTFKTNAPVDIVMIALGTNDLQIKYDKSSQKIIEDLLWYQKVLASEFADFDTRKKYFKNDQMPYLLYILPANFEYRKENPIFNEISEQKRKDIISYFKKSNLNYLEINDIPLFEDGIHYNFEGHEKVAFLVKEYLSNHIN